MARVFMILGAVLAGLSVGTGAFGAHGLRRHFQAHPDLGVVYETACRYHMYHALALLAVAFAFVHWPSKQLVWAGWSFTAGVLVFSGSLYLLALTGARWLGAVTPIGGLALLAGWALLVAALIRVRG